MLTIRWKQCTQRNRKGKPVAPITQQYANITLAKHDAIVARIKQQFGVDILNDGGTITRNTPLGEISIAYSYNATSEVLSLTCTKKPFVVSQASAIQHMNELVNG